MKVNGLEYSFGKVMKVSFEREGAVLYTVEHNPRKDASLCGRIEATVTDMPSAHKDDQPGFSAKITIFNPPRDLLTLVANNASWMTDFARVDTSTMGTAAIAAELETQKPFYDKSRVMVALYAGYYNDSNPDDYGSALIRGYLNGSAWYMKNRDEVLVLEVHDISFTETSNKASLKSAELFKSEVQELEWVQENEKYRRGEVTFDSTFRKYVQRFQSDRLLGAQPPKQTLTFLGLTYTPPQQTLEQCTSGRVQVSSIERESQNWFKVLYVQSREAFMSAIKKNPGGSVDKVLYPKLEVMCKDPAVNNVRKYTDFYSNAGTLDGMLDELCRVAPMRVTWERVWENVSTLTFIVYPVGTTKKFVPGEQAQIQIWNYQNLLEAPAIDGAGMMTVKMLFNPECTTRVALALMLTDELGRANGVAPVSFKAGGQLLGSASSTAQNAVYSATNQITGTQVLASERQNKDAKTRLQKAEIDKRGYMFNTGFPIIRVIHDLSTHGSNWSTTVRTVPMISGLNYGAKKND